MAGLYPPKDMLVRQPELNEKMSRLQGGIGMHGGPGNPLGARAMYLWQGNKDTLFRIHGTVEPWTIGKNVSSGCIRMINQDVMDLYDRTPEGTKVVVLGPDQPTGSDRHHTDILGPPCRSACRRQPRSKTSPPKHAFLRPICASKGRPKLSNL